MQGFLWQDDLVGVAKFVNICLGKTCWWKARRKSWRQTLEKSQVSRFISQAYSQLGKCLKRAESGGVMNVWDDAAADVKGVWGN